MKNFEPVAIEEGQLLELSLSYRRFQKLYAIQMRRLLKWPALPFLLEEAMNEDRDEWISEFELEDIVFALAHEPYLEDEGMAELYHSAYAVVESISNIQRRVSQGHPLYSILQGFDLPQNPSMLSMMAFYSMAKTACQAVDLFTKYTATDVEIDILTFAERYLTHGVISFLQKMKEAAAGYLLRDWQLALQASRLLLHNHHGQYMGQNPSTLLIDMITAADLSYKVHSHQCPPSSPAYILQGECLQYTHGNVAPRFALSKGLKGVVGWNETDRYYVLSFRGTNNAYNILTDIHQALFGADITYLMAVGLLGKLVAQEPESSIRVVGHSLGGGLAQYATLAVDAPNIQTLCYNSAGLSPQSISQLRNSRLQNSSVEHLHISHDIVFRIGQQLGSYYSIPARHGIFKAHKLATVRAETGNQAEIWIK